MTEEKKVNMLIIAVILVIVGFSVLEWVAVEIQTVDVTGYHPIVVTIVNVTKTIMTGAPIAIAIAFGVSLEGYLTKWLRQKRLNEPTDTYSLTWFGETVAKFEGVILVITPFIEVIVQNLPVEYKAIAMAGAAGAFAIFKIALSEIKKTIADVKRAEAASAAAPPPKVSPG